MLKKRLSLVVPAFNEKDSLKRVIRRIHQVVPKYCSDYEIIVVNDGSEDNTGKLADSIASRNSKIKVLHNPQNKGMGYSYWRGVDVASFEYVMIVFGDGDQPAQSIAKVISKIGSADIIIPYYTNFIQTKTWFRHLLSISYTHLINAITGLNIFYYNGITLHKSKLVKQLVGLSTGFGFQAEIIIKLIKNGASFTQVAITNEDDTKKGSSALKIDNVIKVLLSIFRLIWNYKV